MLRIWSVCNLFDRIQTRWRSQPGIR